MKYCMVVDAVQWRKGCSIEGVENRVFDPHEGYTIPVDVGYINYPAGMVRDGDWVVTYPDGARRAMSNTRFQKLFTRL